jgi:hypothetical protein
MLLNELGAVAIICGAWGILIGLYFLIGYIKSFNEGSE